ncbi:Nickel import ATP-binding protein NikO [Slackia heliotrinireducens]|uniref:energy-coupling factor ABC transporter ATP-binding protein n=1 Tax=Slackia heliotrinireducens TaxID=84110 RepID=UPI000F6D7C7A|nr:ABC transporter ATP-binding protein [Slackia heliotrinireducens]VEH00194.1 Nickel import ATP-binding protein NikO [Slackia heliotrinireducens]
MTNAGMKGHEGLSAEERAAHEASVHAQAAKAVEYLEHLEHAGHEKPGRSNEAPVLIEFDHVSFGYEDEPVLDDVSFAIRQGQAVALTGPNGCGKSTALRLINGLLFAKSGEYRFDGQKVDAAAMKNQTFAKRLHQRIGFVFQNPDTQLFCPSVQEEIAFGPRQMGLSEEEVQRRVDDMLDMFDLRKLAKRAPYRLSGGEKHKVAIACVLSMNPDVIVLDEPTNGLDQKTQRLLTRTLHDLNFAGKTVVLSTHDHDLVMDLAARELRMRG